MVLAAVVAAQEAVPTEEALGTTPPRAQRHCRERELGSISGRWSKPSRGPSLPPPSLAPSSVAQLPNPLGTECANCAWRAKRTPCRSRATQRLSRVWLWLTLVPATPRRPWLGSSAGACSCVTECCSVHRSLGRHISIVKHLRHSAWPPTPALQVPGQLLSFPQGVLSAGTLPRAHTQLPGAPHPLADLVLPLAAWAQRGHQDWATQTWAFTPTLHFWQYGA